MDELKAREKIVAEVKNSAEYKRYYAQQWAREDAHDDARLARERRMADLQQELLEKKIKALRDLGVQRFTQDDMTIEFFPPRPPITPEPVAREQKVGQDGLTADEQRALYGANFTDTE